MSGIGANNKSVKSRKGERGSVLAIAAISMLSMILATGMAVDISHFYNAKAELQNAADAAALSATSQLNGKAGGIQLAVQEATKALNKYDFKNDVVLSSSNVQFGQNLNGTYVDANSAQAAPDHIRFVQVTLPSVSIPVSFSAVVLGGSKNLSATATAGMSVGLTMNKFYTAATFVEPTATPMVKGQVYTLAAKAYNDATPTSYRVLAGPDGDLILTGGLHAYGTVGSTYNIAQLAQSEMCRYMKIGINTRFGDYTVHPQANPTDEPPDTLTRETITYQQYTDLQGAGTTDVLNGVRNRRVFTAPMAPASSYNTTNRTVVANKLGAFFVKNKVGTDCNLTVEYIGSPGLAVPDGTFTPGDAQISDLSIPLLYK